RGWQPAFLCPVRPHEQPLLETLGDFPVFAAPVRPDPLRRARRLWLSLRHPQAYAFIRSINLRAEAARALSTFRPDVVHATQPHVLEAVVEALPCAEKRPALVAYAIDVVAKLHIRALLRTELDRRRWRRVAREAALAIPRELRLYAQSDAVICHSDSDRAFLRAFLPIHVPISLLPAWFDACRAILPAVPERRPVEQDMLYVGNSRDPRSREALDWLLGEIFPQVRQRRPNTTLLIAGVSTEADQVRWCRVPQVKCLEFEHNVVSLYDMSQITIAPLKTGGGIHVKVLNAFARACPVVMTSIANDGIGAQDGVEARIADDTAGMVEAILHLLENLTIRQTQAELALRWISHYAKDSAELLAEHIYPAARLRAAQIRQKVY
ncbi:MAG: glycosyltransferase, partial [Thermoflexales bacterium]